MILAGGINSEHISSLSGLGLLQEQSGHYVDPLRWRSGIQGLGVVPLSPGLNGLGSYDADNAMMRGLGGLGTTPLSFATADWSLQGSALATLAPSLGTAIGFTIPNWAVYAGIAFLVFKNR